MKRKVIAFIGLASLGLSVSVGAMVWAQYPPQQVPSGPQQPIRPVAHAAPAGNAPTLRTRIALVNRYTIGRGYKKAEVIQDRIRVEMEEYEKKVIEPLRTQMIKLRTALQNPQLEPSYREQYERDMRKLQLQLQEADEDARKKFMAQQGVLMKQLYQEIEEAVRVFATRNDIELVLFYMDPTNPDDPYNPATVQAKLSQQGCFPIYMTPGMDISKAIVDMLNQRYPVNAPVGASGGTPPGSPR
ncbi:MAG: OmpH family outer membrane protein [Gemmataceae bacterium]